MHAFGFKVTCGVQLKPLGGISCFSEALPSTELDGYVELHNRGKPRLGERGDSPWRPGKNAKLRRGQAWKRAGVRCAFSKDGSRTIRCLNAEGIGFKLGPTVYEPIGAS